MAIETVKLSVDLNKLREGARMVYEKKATLAEALLHAGYAQSTALSTKVPNVFHRFLAEFALADGRQYVEIGKKVSAQDAEHLIAGRLVKNTIDGSNAGNEAAHLLGKMKRVGAFEKDSMTGVVILAAPGSGNVAGKVLSAPDEGDFDVIEGEL